MNIEKIQLIGIGSASVKILNKFKLRYPYMTSIAIDFNKDILSKSDSDKKILLIDNYSINPGADMCYGVKFSNQIEEEILKAVDKSKNIILVAALGDGCNGGVFSLSKMLLYNGINISAALLSTPFRFEGRRRKNLGIFTFLNMQSICKVISVDYDDIVISSGMTLREIFSMADSKFLDVFAKFIDR